jgi:uncharacterized repeat protein (TIGR01451 family)
VHIVATTSAQACGTYDNTASFTTTNDGSGNAEAIESCQVPVVSITKTADHNGTPVTAGDQVGFVVTISNAGPGTATGVTVDDPLPAGVTWSIDAANSDPGWSINGSNHLVFGPASMAANTSKHVHIVATTSAQACGTYDNTASFTTTNDGSGNAEAIESCQVPVVSITKTADHNGTPVTAGDQVGFVVTISNAGPGTATGVTVDDPLPAGVTWSIDAANSDPGWSINGSNHLVFGPASMAANTSKHVHIVATTDATHCGTYNNTASFTTTNDGSGSAGATESCQKPSLHISKAANPVGPVAAGNSIGFDITVSNTGPGTAKNVTVTDTLPIVSGQTWSINPTVSGCSISAGSPQVLTCSFGDQASPWTQVIHVTSGTSNADCTTYQNQASATSSNNDPLTVTSTIASVTVTCPIISSLQPTQTTCSQFLQGTNQPITQIQYSVKGNPSKINQTNPGVFFYFVQLNFSTSGSKTVHVTQLNTTSPFVLKSPPFPAQSIQVFSVVAGTTTCNNVSLTGSSTGTPADVSATFNASTGTNYVVAVKYSTSSIAGSAAPNPTTQQYTYATTGVAGSTQTLNLVKK